MKHIYIFSTVNSKFYVNYTAFAEIATAKLSNLCFLVRGLLSGGYGLQSTGGLRPMPWGECHVFTP